jgi:hypothetical protein
MKKARKAGNHIRREYKRSELGPGVRGRFFEAYRKAHNLVLLKPEVAAAFPTEQAVNAALMSLVRIVETTRRPAARTRGRAAKVARRSTTAQRER